MKNFMAVGMVWIFVAGFWGMAFPEYCFTQDAIEIVNSNTKVEERFDSEKDFEDLLNSNSQEIEVKCKLFELWKQEQKRE